MGRDTLAWELYCDETKGDMHVADFWEQLPEKIKELYRKKLMAKNEGNTPSYDLTDVDELLMILLDHTKPRSAKEAALKRIREIERETGETIYGNYNWHGERIKG